MTLQWLERDRQLAAQLVICKAALYLLVPAFINAIALRDQYSVTVGQLLAVLLFFAGTAAAAALVRLRSAAGLVRRPQPPPPVATHEVTRAHVLILLLSVLALWLINVYAWFEYGLFMRRIGTEEIAQVYAGLPSAIRVASRLWDVLMGPSLILLVTYYWRALRSPGRIIVGTLCAGYAVFGIFNSRLLMFDFLLLFLIVRKARFGTFMKYVPLLLAPALVTFLLRADFNVGMVRGQVWNEWIERTDCFSVIGEIDRHMWSASDPLWGESWMGATVGRVRALFDPSFRRAYLADAETGSKNVIAASFALGKGADYVSCIVSDVYGNLWLPGTFLIGFVLVLLAAALERRLHVARGVHDRLFMVASLATVLLFERDLSDVAVLIVMIWGAALALCWLGWPWHRDPGLA